MSLSLLTHCLSRPLRLNGCSISCLPKLVKTYSSGPSPSSTSFLGSLLRLGGKFAAKLPPQPSHVFLQSCTRQCQSPAATVQMRPLMRKLGLQSPVLHQTPLRSFRESGGGGVLMNRSGSVHQLLPVRIAGLATMSEGVLQRLQNQVHLLPSVIITSMM